MRDFCVIDPAMGSGHFLLDAVDAIANQMNTFLRDNASVAAKALEVAREHVTAMGKRYGIENAGEHVGDFELLRRM
jgi:phosphoheptose isomerase